MEYIIVCIYLLEGDYEFVFLGYECVFKIFCCIGMEVMIVNSLNVLGVV